MKVHNVNQGSVDWAILRAGVPTASEMNNLLTDSLEVRKGEMPRTYVAKKLAEWWTGGPLAEFNNFDCEQGSILEQEAIPFLELEFNTSLQRVGFITTDDGKAGCSPDAMTNASGIECKCPRIETHIRYLLNGTVPKEYLPQIHASMFVTGFDRWMFVSYRRRLPMLCLEVEADADAQLAIGDALESFWFNFEEGKKKLCELNGGPPKRFNAPSAPASSSEPEYVDIIP